MTTNRFNHLETAIAYNESVEMNRHDALIADAEFDDWIAERDALPPIRCRQCNTSMPDYGEAICEDCTIENERAEFHHTEYTDSWCPF